MNTPGAISKARNFRSVHPYPAKMAPEIALKALQSLPPGSVVLDPMCGGGTVLEEAAILGHHPIGFDIDPLAVLIAKVATMVEIPHNLHQRVERLLDHARGVPGRGNVPTWVVDDPASQEFVDFWFARRQQHQLRKLIHLIGTGRSEWVQIAKLAISRTIITKSGGASLAADTSHSRPHRVRSANEYDVYGGFEKSIRHIETVLHQRPRLVKSHVYRGDARNLRRMNRGSVDLVITSPPYVNAIDYLRGHRLSLVWLGYPYEALKGLHGQYVRSEIAFRRRFPPPADLHAQYASDALPDNLKRILSRYISDMSAIASEIARLLKSGKQSIVVVGDSTLKGVAVNTGKIVTSCFEGQGLRLHSEVVRDIPNDRRYLPPPTASGTGTLDKRMRSESILTFVNA